MERRAHEVDVFLAGKERRGVLRLDGRRVEERARDDAALHHEALVEVRVHGEGFGWVPTTLRRQCTERDLPLDPAAVELLFGKAADRHSGAIVAAWERHNVILCGAEDVGVLSQSFVEIACSFLWFSRSVFVVCFAWDSVIVTRERCR